MAVECRAKQGVSHLADERPAVRVGAEPLLRLLVEPSFHQPSELLGVGLAARPGHIHL